MSALARRFSLLVLTVLLAVAPAPADSIKGDSAAGYGRLLFTLTNGDKVKAAVHGTVLSIDFGRKVGLTPQAVVQALPLYLSNGHAETDGQTYNFVLNGPVRLHTSTVGNQFAIDLAPASYKATPPDLPKPPGPAPIITDEAKLPLVKVRSGAYHNFTRIVFDWPSQVGYSVSHGPGMVTLRFNAQAKPDYSALDRQAPPWVKAAGWQMAGRDTVVEFHIDYASGYHDFRDGSHVVLDVLSPKTDADAYNPPGGGKGTIVALNGAAAPQAKAPAAKDASAKDAAAKTPQATASAHTVPPQTAPADTAPPAGDQTASTGDDSVPVTVDGKLTGSGAVLTFAGAGRKPAAVFTRGVNAFIILQNAAPLDVIRLKNQLGTFPVSVDAVAGDGTVQLRIGLKQPQAIAAIPEGSNLKVVIAPSVTPTASALGFARNQEDPTHSTISTLLPGAEKMLRVVDPQVGDELWVIPGNPGRYVDGERNYVEFSTLPSAAGLVLLPYVDNLAVSVQGARVSITRPGGLSLTPPSMPAAGTPEAMAANAASPCFLDFARWGTIRGGSFLATERHLREAAARLPADQAYAARLKLARFYLANHFSAEALGVIGFMQTADPGLQGDMALQTMKAAASYDMGRYRDARNALAGAQFDADRHAALWRGLAEAGLENWDDARQNLDRAAPVLKAYDEDTRTRVRLASAETALAQMKVEVADAELSRLPNHVAGELGLHVKLDQARLHAAEHRGDSADILFNQLQASGNELYAAEATYYRVTAGLAANTLKPDQAINALERLRYRWRGDELELKTLRKLATIYFSQKRWREGLNTLRVAATNFGNEDAGIQAMDDMRSAFVNLFLKGEADKMAPVKALGLFYDFIDLTPIGSDGDEMIRHMADRLVKVDLLGPAADLLNYQVTKRLDGVARAQVATKLAVVQLMDHKPQDVLETLRTTQISTLPDTVMHQRLLMEARALTEQKRYDHALDLLAVDEQPDTQALRAEIYWQSGNWALAGQTAEQALGERYKDDKPLSDSERQTLMRAAVAYSLANDQTSLDRIRSEFAPKMRGTPDAAGFAVVTQRIDLQGVAFRDAAAQLASIDTLKAFMQDLQKTPLAK